MEVQPDRFRGVWKRLVTSCNEAIYALLGNRLITEEVISTIMSF